MNILTVDDEQSALNILNRAVRQAQPDAVIQSFDDADTLLETVESQVFLPDVAFLDIEIPGLNGLELARRLKTLCPKVNIVFVTGFSQYALDAYALRPSGYLTKPVTPEDVENELNNLRNPVEPHVTNGLQVQCFGNFEVFTEGTPLEIKSEKAKELLALLVDRRGSSMTTAGIAMALFEEQEYSTYIKNRVQQTVSQLRIALKAAGCEDVLIKGHNSTAIDTDKIDCDYYRFLQGDIHSINSFSGEYMAQYSWAEFTSAYLYWKA